MVASFRRGLVVKILLVSLVVLVMRTANLWSERERRRDVQTIALALPSVVCLRFKIGIKLDLILRVKIR